VLTVNRNIPLLLFLLVRLLAATPSAYPADGTPAQEPKQACCKHDGADIVRWLRNADRFYGQFKPKEAVGELQKILRLDGQNFEALVKLARAHIDIGDLIAEDGADWKERKIKEYSVAEDYAREAVKVDPRSTWGHFWVAASVGNIAMVSPVAKQVELAGEIREQVEKAIALDPKNGLAYHIYGVWHRKIAEIGSTSRVFASLVYGRSLPQGSLEKSIEYLKKAIALNPAFIISRLELARSHVAKEQWEPARALLRSIPELPIQFSDDAKHKQKSEQLLEEIKDR
jgi:tetratricopeptide (TPR) repeat protein